MAAPGTADHANLVNSQCVEDGDRVAHMPFHLERTPSCRRGQSALLESDYLVGVQKLGLEREGVVGEPWAPVQQQNWRSRAALPGVDMTSGDRNVKLVEDCHSHSMPERVHRIYCSRPYWRPA